MLQGKKILAVVPARSGSKGIPHKNLKNIGGVSLIGRAAITLSQAPFIDAKILSTDSSSYAEEGKQFGLEVPFLRPPHLSTDEAGAIETMQHALLESEKIYKTRFDILMIIEPTSPMRIVEDLNRAVSRLIASEADSAVTVSPLSTKAHPQKILKLEGDRLRFFSDQGGSIQARQALNGNYFWRNGICYALIRNCLLENNAIFTDRTVAEIITRPVVNIDDPIDVKWAEFLLQQGL